MNVKSVVENKEKFEVELTVEVGQEEFEAAIEKVYRKSRGNISVPGFRKGKAPRKVIEGMYGAGVFYEDAIEEVYPTACNAAIAEQGLDQVAPPQVEILTLGKEGFSFKATVTVRPEVTLKQYKGLEADKVLPTVTEEAVDAELQQYVERATQLVAVEREAKLGDSAVIDYEGLKDGVAFAGGTAKGYELALGSGTFIPGFEDQVVGMKAGDEKDINLTFPEEYHAEELAGQPVVFKVKCIEVKEKQAPALDDEFAKDVSEFDTLAEFKEDLKSKIIDRNMQQSEAKFRQNLLAQMCDQIDIELPEAMVETQIDRFVENYAARLESQGISLETYMQYLQMEPQQMRDDLREPAVTQAKQQLALDAVVAAENIVISDEEVEAEIKKAVDSMNMPYERVVEGLDREGLKKELARDKAMAVVAENAKANMIAADAENGEIKLTSVTKEEVEAEKEEKKAKKTRAKKTTEEGEAAPKKTTRKKKADAEAEKVEAEKVEE
ncbi:MAG: trigger factor [Ruminiclostridium sp.]|nr:trigger factor [Ruminiclostridium sp.]